MPDGTIVIDTRINSDGVNVGTKEIESSIKSSAASMSKSVESVRNNMTEITKATLKSAKQQTAAQSDTMQEYTALKNEIQTLEERLDLLNNKQRLFLEAGGSANDSIFKNTALEIDRLNQKLEQARTRLQQMSTAGQGAGVGVSGAASANVSGLAAQEKNLTATNASLTSSFANLRSAVMGYLQSTVSAAIQSGVLKERFFSLLNGIKRLAQEAIKAAANLAQMAGRGIIGGLKRVSAGILSIHKNSRKAGYSLGAMLRSGLLMGIVFRAFSGIITGITKGFQNLAQYSDTTNKSLSMLKSSLTQLKNAFATAFAPILDVAAPILSRFINLISAALNAVGRLVATLTGKSTFTKAVAVQEDYAASLADTASSASDAAKATDEAAEAAEGYLSPLDEINKMEKKDNLADSLSGGGGTGGTSPADMFETVRLEPFNFDSWGEAFSAFLDYLLNTGIPALRNALSGIAKTVNTFSANLYQMFSFPGVVDKVRLLGQEISNAFNDFVNWIDWEMIGAALGSGLNLAFQFLVNLIYTFDWQNLGASLATMLNRALSEIDWRSFGMLLWSKFKIAIETLAGFLTNLDMSKVSQAASDLVMGFIDAIKETLINVDWQSIGNQIAAFFAGINYSGIADSLFSGLGAALASLAEFLWGIIENAWDSVVTWWHDAAFEDGEFTMEGLLNGILEKLKGIGVWIKEHIFQPFIDGFKEAFGIASPSTVMFEMGVFLMEGLFNGIDSLKEKIISIFSEIKEKVSSVWENLKRVTTSIWDGMKNTIRSAINGIIRFLNGLISGIVSAMNAVVDTLNRFHVDVPDAIADFTGIHSFGFDIARFDTPRIPYLASGAVIPPNREFMAILGDQKSGTNIEAPESLIRKLLREELAKQQTTGNKTYSFTAQLNRRTLFEEFIKEAQMQQMRTGKNPFELA